VPPQQLHALRTTILIKKGITMDLIKDLCVEMVNHSDCSGSDTVHLAYLLFARDNENYRTNDVKSYNDEDECDWIEQPF